MPDFWLVSRFKVLAGIFLVYIGKHLVRTDHLLGGDLRLAINDSAIPINTRTAMSLGLLERAERRLVVRHLPHGLPCIEIGSSFGNVTLDIVKKIGNRTPLLSIEANPRLANWLAVQVNASD